MLDFLWQWITPPRHLLDKKRITHTSSRFHMVPADADAGPASRYHHRGWLGSGSESGWVYVFDFVVGLHFAGLCWFGWCFVGMWEVYRMELLRRFLFVVVAVEMLCSLYITGRWLRY